MRPASPVHARIRIAESPLAQPARVGRAPTGGGVRHAWAWLLLIIALGALLRFVALGAQSLWLDEIMTALSSSGSWRWVLTQTLIDNQTPPLYYAIVHAVTVLGQGEAALRLPSALFGTGAVPLLHVVVREWFGERPGLIAAGLLALSPLAVWYSQEARPYSLLLVLSLLALLLLQRAIRDPRSRWRYAAFALAAAATFYSHTVAAAFLAFLGVCVIVLVPRTGWRPWLAAFAATGLLIVPAVAYLAMMPPLELDPARPFTPLALPYLFWTFAVGTSLGPSVLALHEPGRLHTVEAALPVIFPVALVFAVLLGAGLLAAWRRSRTLCTVVVAWIAIPVIADVAGSFVMRQSFNVRYAIVALPAFLLLVALGVCAPRRRAVRAAALGLVALTSIASLRNYYTDPGVQRDDMRAAGRFLAAAAAPGDLIIANATYTAIALHFYLPRPDLTILAYPTVGNAHELEAAGLARARELALRPPARGSPVADLAELVGSRTRFWIFVSRGFEGADGSAALDYCAERFQRERVMDTANGVQIFRCDSEASPSMAAEPRDAARDRSHP